jgi:hypothetical protein
MPQPVQQILRSYHDCNSRQDGYRWCESAAEKIISLAEISPQHSTPVSERGFCPLCEGSADVVYAQGFAFPEGLRRHLTGWGNVRQCGVMAVVKSMAREYFDDKFRDEDEAEKKRSEESHRQVQHRLRTEILYRTTAFRDPELIDSVARFGDVRTQIQMEWAEQRLAELGFRIQVDGNVKSYTAESDDVIVYADPREAGRITFCPYKKPLLKPKRTRHPSLDFNQMNSFFILDGWKHDIEEKYNSRLAEATAKLK